MTLPERIGKLIGLLAIAFTWRHLTGGWIDSQQPIIIKKNGRKAVSVFRPGLDHIGRILHNISILYHEVDKILKITLRYLISTTSYDTS